MAHCSACEVATTSLHMPPTHLRVNKALVELRGPAISLCVSCLRGKPVDTSISWIPNTADSDPRRPHLAPRRTRTDTAHQIATTAPLFVRIQGSGSASYQAGLSGQPLRQHSQQNPIGTTSPEKPPEQITVIQTPSHKGRVCASR